MVELNEFYLDPVYLLAIVNSRHNNKGARLFWNPFLLFIPVYLLSAVVFGKVGTYESIANEYYNERYVIFDSAGLPKSKGLQI